MPRPTAVPPPTTAGPLLRVRGLGVRRGRRQVLHDVDLDVHPGEVVAVLGPNGAGKSTLLEAVAGLVGSTGTVECHGRVSTVLQTAGMAKRSVRANVLLALSWWGVPRAERSARADDALRRMHADHLARRFAPALSGGEARRVHLARGIAVGSEVLLLDEPFAGLDPESHAALADDATAALRASSGAVLVTLHERADAWAMADRVVVLLEGRVAADGPPDELLRHPPSAAVARFLGYDGQLDDGDHVLLTRPSHVRVVAADGDEQDGFLPAVVTRVVRLQDGSRLDLETARGSVRALHPSYAVEVGQRVVVRLDGGVRYPRGT